MTFAVDGQYFVADSATRSAPELDRPAEIVRWRTCCDDEGRRDRWASLARGYVVGDDDRRLAIVSRTAPVGAREGPHSTAARSRPPSDEVVVTRGARRRRSAGPRVPYEARVATNPIAGRQQRPEGGVDRAHPGGEREPGLGASSSATAKRTRRQVGLSRPDTYE